MLTNIKQVILAYITKYRDNIVQVYCYGYATIDIVSITGIL